MLKIMPERISLWCKYMWWLNMGEYLPLQTLLTVYKTTRLRQKPSNLTEFSHMVFHHYRHCTANHTTTTFINISRFVQYCIKLKPHLDFLMGTEETVGASKPWPPNPGLFEGMNSNINDVALKEMWNEPQNTAKILGSGSPDISTDQAFKKTTISFRN